MKIQFAIIGIVIILVSVGLSGCSNSPKNLIVGTWWSEEGVIVDSLTFCDNGSVCHKYVTVFDEEWEHYSIAEDKLIIGVIVYKFTLVDDNLKLVLTNFSENTTRTYIRQ